MFPVSLVQLTTRCVDLYLTLGCFTSTWSSSLRGMFHLCVMLECFPEYLVKLSTRCVDFYLTLGCFTGTWSSSLRGVFDLYLTLGCSTGPQHNNYINPYTFFVFEIWKLYPFIYFSIECSIHHYAIKFVCDAVVFSGFLHQKNWDRIYNAAEILLKVALNTIILD